MFRYWGVIFHIRRCSDDSWNVQPYSQLWSSQCNKFFEWIVGMEFGSQYLQSTGVVNQDAGHSWIKCLFLMGWHLHTPGPRHPVPAEGDIDIPFNLQYAMYPVHVHEERRNRTHITGCGMEQWSEVVESPTRRLRRWGGGVTKVTLRLNKSTFAVSMDSTSVGATSEETIVV